MSTTTGGGRAAPGPDGEPDGGRVGTEPDVGRSSAVMAAGTITSRLTGFIRDAVLIWAIGTAVFADAYNVANTVPNVLYILLAGGALNAVFVPQLVKAMREDADGGKAYADRLITTIALLLLVITVVAVLAAPAVITAYAFTYTQGDEQTFEVAVTFARFLLPQIFFYGLHVMLGQVLNARGRFGPMMFTPILNNVVVIATGVAFLVVTSGQQPSGATVSDGELRLLGIGTTVGVVLQALALLPFLRSTGYRYRPRFDVRHAGLGTAYRLAAWTLLFVLLNQIAYLVVVQVATASGTAALDAGAGGRGFTPYTKAYLIMLLPHAVVTVSVVTALLPRMARAVTDGRPQAVRTDLAGGLRLTGAALVPAAFAFLVLGPAMAVVMFGHGNTSVADAEFIGRVLSAFALGLIPFSVHHQFLRGFFAFSDTRTPVTINVWIAATNIALALACLAVFPPEWVVVGLAGSYSLSYLVGAVISARALRRRLGGVGDGRVLGAYAKLVAAAAAAAAATYALVLAVEPASGPTTGSSVLTLVAGGVLFVTVFAATAWRLRIEEVRGLAGVLGARLHRAGRGGR